MSINLNKPIIVLHDSGGKPYYQVLEKVSSDNIEYYELSVFRLLIKDILQKKVSLLTISRTIKNILFRLRVPFIKNRTIIFAAAPFDARIIWYNFLLKKNYVIYHSSWHDWLGDFFPRKIYILNRVVLSAWKSLITESNKIVTVTNVVKNQINEWSGYNDINNPSHKITVIPHCIDNTYNNSTELNKVENKKKKVLFVGKLIPEKGISLFCELAKRNNNEFEFTIVGDGPEKAEIKELEKQNKVQYLGFISNRKALKKVFYSHDILIVPSIRTNKWEELFGMVIIEAMSEGCIVIASNHIGPRQIIKNKIDGFLVPENNISAIEEVLFQLNDLSRLIPNVIASSNEYSINNLKKKWLAQLPL